LVDVEEQQLLQRGPLVHRQFRRNPDCSAQFSPRNERVRP
jgi:hypothetical protein